MNKKVEFVDYVDDINEGVENMYVSKDKFDINQFNKIFEKYKVPDANDDGYGDLYKQDLNSSKTENIFGEKFNKEVFNSTFDNVKNKKVSSDIIEYREPEAVFASNTSGFTELGLGRVEDFSGSSYTDYKKAHVDETMLIDVNKVKYKQYNSIEQLKQDRENLSYKQTEEDKIRYSQLERLRREKEEERRRFQQDRDDLLSKQYNRLNTKLIVHKDG